jgi:hypothetical protein
MTRAGGVAGRLGILKFPRIMLEVLDYPAIRVSTWRSVAPGLQRGGPHAAVYDTAVYGLW